MSRTRHLVASRRGLRLQRSAVALYALAALVLIAPQLLGGVYPWGMLAIATLALFAFVAGLATVGLRHARLDLLALAMLAALGWTIVQALPLPCAAADALSPVSADALRKSHRALGLPAPGYCPLSLDPGNTREEIVKGIAIVAAFLAAAMLARAGYRRWLLYAFGASGVALALTGLAHAGLGAERVFGWYEPIELARPPVLSPLLNPNTLGGMLATCVPVLIGIALAERSPRFRWLLLLATGLVASCVLMTRSRGAVGALFMGVVLIAVLALRRRNQVDGSTGLLRDRLAVPLGLGAALAVAGYGWHEEVTAEFENGDLSKLELLAAGAALALEHPLLGIGRGAFGSAFTAVHDTPLRFEHAENFVLQWIGEWGWPVAGLLLLALARAAGLAARRARSFHRIGAVAGVLTLAAQNLLDLGLELVGVAVPAAVLLAAASTDRARDGEPSERSEHGLRRRERALVAAAVLGATLVAVLWQPVLRDHAVTLEQQLQAASARGDRAAFRRSLAPALSAHPTEPIFVILAADEALRHRDPAAGRFINRAMQLAPGWVAPHLQAAEWLLAAGRLNQSLLELGIAARIDPWASRALLCPMAERHLEPVAALAPAGGDERAEFYRALTTCFSNPASGHAARLDAIVLREYPRDPSANVREATRRLAAGDAEAALTMARRVASGTEEFDKALLVQAKALSTLGRKREALQALRRAARRSAAPGPLLVLEARLHAELGDRAAMHAALDRLKGLATRGAADLARAFALEAQLERQLGSEAGALRAFEQAYSVTGDTNALRGIAQTAESLGNRGRALWAYGQLCVAGDTHACERRKALTGERSYR